MAVWHCRLYVIQYNIDIMTYLSRRSSSENIDARPAATSDVPVWLTFDEQPMAADTH